MRTFASRPFNLSALLAAFTLFVALSSPRATLAIGIGEIVLQSGLGEPLLARVELKVGSGERIDNACLSLVLPDSAEDSSGFLSKADLALKTVAGRQYVVISSRKSFNDAFAKLRLQVKCPGMGTLVKTLTILPDFNPSPVVQESVAAIEPRPAETDSVAPPIMFAGAPAANLHETGSASAKTGQTIFKKMVPPAGKRYAPPVRTAEDKTDRPAFRLKLSGDPLDESRIGKITPEERALLLARQKFIDADDQMANFLVLQHQVKLLQDELGEIKLQVAQLSAAPAVAASSTLALSPAPLAAAVQKENIPKPVVATKTPVVQQDSSDLQRGLLVALGLILAILALWQGLRSYTKSKSNIKIKSQQDAEPVHLRHSGAEAARTVFSGKRPVLKTEASLDFLHTPDDLKSSLPRERIYPQPLKK